MPKVVARGNESFEKLYGRFKRAVEKSGILKELHAREFFERPGEKRKKARAAAVMRWKRKVEQEREELIQQRLARKRPNKVDDES